MTPRIEIQINISRTSVLIDGKDISDMVESYQLETPTNDVARLHLVIPIVQRDQLEIRGGRPPSKPEPGELGKDADK